MGKSGIEGLGKLIGELAKTESDPELSLQEIQKRALRLKGKMEGLKPQLAQLESVAQKQIAAVSGTT